MQFGFYTPKFEFCGDVHVLTALAHEAEESGWHRRGGAPFDVVTIGQTRSPRDTGNVAAVAEAGATWWLEYIFTWDTSLEATRARIHRGPPRP